MGVGEIKTDREVRKREIQKGRGEGRERKEEGMSEEEKMGGEIKGLEAGEKGKDRQTDRQTDRQAGRQAGKQTGRQTDRKRHTEPERCKHSMISQSPPLSISYKRCHPTQFQPHISSNAIKI